MTTILVATDFSSTARRAVGEAIALARLVRGRIEVVHVHPIKRVPVPFTLDLATVPPSPEAVASAEVALAEDERQVREGGIDCSSYSAFGAPADEVVRRAAEIGAAYLVVGRHGHSALTEALVGSVAAGIVRGAPCPVLVVSGLMDTHRRSQRSVA